MTRTSSLALLGLAALTAAPLLDAQTFSLRKRTPSILGSKIDIRASGAATNKALVLAISTNAGPTALGPLVGDPRSIAVGTDLVSLWPFFNTGKSGGVIMSFTLPDVAVLRGQEIHGQALTGPGSKSAIDAISNKLILKLGSPQATEKLSKGMLIGRALLTPARFRTATSMRGEKFMLPGGGTGTILGASGLKTTEIFDTNTLRTTRGPDMSIPRALNIVAELPGGKILIAGGVTTVNNVTVVLNTCEVYDPATNKFAATGSMSVARAGHAAAVLSDGRVLVAGGTKELSDIIKMATSGLQSSTEIYDPKTGKWTSAGSLNKALLGPSLTTLKTGKVLLTGGLRVVKFFGIPTRVETVKSAEWYDPTAKKWSDRKGMITSRGAHTFNTHLLSDGRVLVTGGLTASIALIPPPKDLSGIKAIANSEVYNPTTNTWAALANLPAVSTAHTVNTLPDGNAILIGGASGSVDKPVSLKTVLVFNVKTNKFTRLKDLNVALAGHATVLTHAGEVVLIGGNGSGSAPTLKDMSVYMR